jgi:hypothetical protein
LNDDAAHAGKWHWFGALSVAPNGRIDVVWLDTRNATDNLQSQLFYSFSTDGGNSWSPNVAVSAAFNPKRGYPNQNKIGDYLSIVSTNDAATAAYSATFNGEQDVYAVRLDPAVVGTFYNISTSANPSGSGSITGAGNYVAGSNVTVTATPISCNTFVSWTENSNVVSNSANYQFVANADRVLVANFSPISFTIMVNTTAGGSATGGGNFNCGSNATVTATPDPGFSFMNWTEGTSVVSNSASYTFSATANRTLTAHFGAPVAAPMISPSGGTFRKKVKVTMTCATAGATIRYTTDGTDPTSTSPIYRAGGKKNKGVKISGQGAHTVKAQATKSGLGESAVTTANFTIN